MRKSSDFSNPSKPINLNCGYIFCIKQNFASVHKVNLVFALCTDAQILFEIYSIKKHCRILYLYPAMPDYYSVLRASTGSFLAATLDGITPAMSVSTILIITRITAAGTGSIALSPSISVRL